MQRCGIGYDVHRFAEGRPLILGGVEIPHVQGLDGHSDADALCHAIADAILGALGDHDIGFYFPPGDESIAGISSLEILREVRRIAERRGAWIHNIDSTVIAEAPKIMPHAAAMKAAIAGALGLDPHQIGIKATTNEMMGFIGRREGIAAMAVASVEVRDDRF
ncbi:MAG: 2-C-methyl-D-erythritol 2,4-cyclodiphosphate synthase [Verrucomicrobiales bacterium]|nr:2-C-methyl-D-erythritol 2,4-cyclodiphosphate synthase [Verrucomicrobiales bacterium]